jgi:predicted branched-subunit amino acid permease
MSQLVALDAWPERFGTATVASLAILCAIVNARLLLMSATLQPWLGGLPRWQVYPSLHILTDPGWLIAMRYRADGGSDVGVYYGSSIVLFAAWTGAIVAGYLMGGLVADPSRFGIDLVMPIFFAAMLVPLWHGARRGIAWLVAGAVSLIVYYGVGGWWFVVAGAIAGSVAGGFLDDAE